VVVLHFVSALAFSAVERQLNARMRGTVRLLIIYDKGKGVLRAVLRVCGQKDWQLTELDADDGDVDGDQVSVTMTLSGTRIGTAAQALGEIDGVSAVFADEDEPD
jgi:putative Mg2+ transporter-C (MgtC) family protein